VRTATAQTTAAPVTTHDASEPGTATGTAPDSSTEAFSWTKAWYPVMCIDNLDPDQPNKFQLLGK
jgi:hypothetical protein